MIDETILPRAVALSLTQKTSFTVVVRGYQRAQGGGLDGEYEVRITHPSESCAMVNALTNLWAVVEVSRPKDGYSIYNSPLVDVARNAASSPRGNPVASTVMAYLRGEISDGEALEESRWRG